MDDILKAINTIADQLIRIKTDMDKTDTKYERCMIVGKNSNGTYNIKYDGYTYPTKAINNLDLNVGDMVMVVIPKNQISKRFIIGTI